MTEAIPEEYPSTKLPLGLTIGLVVLAFALASGVIIYSGFRELQNGGKQDAVALADYGAVPEFVLTERSEKSISLADLKGSIWVADFIFTHCAGPCPRMTMQMAEVQRAIAAAPHVKLVSYSVDPERDTPEVLRSYADGYGADPERWWFLTGPVQTISHLAVNGFHVGTLDDPILHSTLFALVDRRGHIRGYYHSDDPELIKKITDDIAILVRDKRV